MVPHSCQIIALLQLAKKIGVRGLALRSMPYLGRSRLKVATNISLKKRELGKQRQIGNNLVIPLDTWKRDQKHKGAA